MTISVNSHGGDIVGDLSLTVSNSTNASGQITLMLDGTAPAGPDRAFTPAGGGAFVTVSTRHRWAAVPPGAHTVSGRWLTGGGTLTATGTLRELVVEEKAN